MNKRSFLKATAATAAIASVGGLLWVRVTRSDAVLSVDNALAMLDSLSGRTLTNAGDWSAAQVFTHIAQSIEYSMTGYPTAKSALFQNTAGKAALAVFSSRRAMSHNLHEPIPGAPVLDANADIDQAVARTRAALLRFADYSGPLQPHFAYGALSHKQYALAHAMHLNNHLEIISVT